jgi:hypothetical protein
MFNALLNTLFGCSHRRTSFPLTPRRKLDNNAGRAPETYVVCLDCGTEFGYDWQKMQVRKPVSVLIPSSAVQEKPVRT